MFSISLTFDKIASIDCPIVPRRIPISSSISETNFRTVDFLKCLIFSKAYILVSCKIGSPT